VLTNAEPNVATGRVAGAEVTAVLDVVLGGTEKVSTAGDEAGDGLGDVIEDFTAAVGGGGCVLGRLIPKCVF
jgi:hypothetical protein